MRITSLPWEAALVFLGYIHTNLPIFVSVFTAAEIDKTLKGHWLNWLNIFLPIFVGAAGLIAYSKFGLDENSRLTVFFYGPLLITAIWMILFAVLINVFVFTAVDSQRASTGRRQSASD